MNRACVVRQYHVPHDPRVWREANALGELFDEIDVICMRGNGESWTERLGNVRVLRLPIEHKRGGKLRYLFEYAAFGVLAFVVLTFLHIRHRYRLVQVHSLPDALVFSAIFPRLTGTRIVLDLHEPMPEFFQSKFGVGEGNRWVRLVRSIEQLAIRFSHLVITPTNQMRERFIQRGANAATIHVVMNGSDESVFDPSRFERDGNSNRFRLICHGSIEERYGLDTVIRALPLIQPTIPEVLFQIIGRGAYKSELRRLAERLGVRDLVEFSEGYIPEDELVQALAQANVGIVAMKRDEFRDLTLCLKMFDFIAMELPVVSSRTRAVTEYFGGDCFAMFESDDPESLAQAVTEIYVSPDRGRSLARAASSAFAPYRWDVQRIEYQRLIANVLRGHEPATQIAAGQPTTARDVS